MTGEAALCLQTELRGRQWCGLRASRARQNPWSIHNLLFLNQDLFAKIMLKRGERAFF